MMNFFGEDKWGKAILSTIKGILVEKESLTSDSGGAVSTSRLGNRFVEILSTEAIQMGMAKE